MILKDDSMISFETPEQFRTFYENLLKGEQWKITTDTLNDRGYHSQDESYVKELRDLFNAKGLFRRSVSIAEIMSFMDSYYIMDKVFDALKKMLTPGDYNRINMCCEYRIKYSKNRRIDYILKYHNKILLIEFRLSATFPNMSSVWQKKETELLIYKELLNNYIPKECHILIYAFIAMPEYDKKRPIYKHIKYNNQNAQYFADYINEFLINTPSISQVQ